MTGDGTEDVSEKQVAVVCHGNICRSYMAEHVFRRHITGATFFSAGVMPHNVGGAPDAMARRVLERHGYTTEHTCRGISDAVIAADLILVMNHDQREVFTLLGARPERVRLVSSFDPMSHGEEPANPWNCSQRVFEYVLALFERCVPDLRRHCHS